MSLLDNKGRREVFENDLSVRNQSKGVSLAELAALRNPSPGGRFGPLADTVGQLGKPATVTIWEHDPKEPPLGYSVNDQEPCGTSAEIEASRRRK
jgi:hypothetical protein